MTDTANRLLFSLLFSLGWLLCAAAQAQTNPNQSNPAPSGNASAQERVIRETREQSAEVQKLMAAGKYAEAQPLAEKILAAREQALGPEHAEVASTLTQLATIYRNRADFGKAESTNQRALAIAEKLPAPGHPELGQILNEMGTLYAVRADYVKAEPLFQRAVGVWEQALGPNHPTVARGLNNLANVYGARRDRAKAEPLLRRALEIRERALGPDHSEVTSTLIGLGNLNFNDDNFDGAEPYYQRALQLLDKLAGQANPTQHALVLNNLAAVYASKGDLTQAETLHRRVLAIREKALGAEHPQTLTTLNNIAALRADQGDFEKAEQMQQSALSLTEKVLGPEHPDVALTLQSLARDYTAMGAWERAITTMSRAVGVTERNIAHNLAAGSERQKLAYLSTAAKETDRTISLNIRSAPRDPAARQLALTTILQRKGRALDAMVDSLSALRRRATPEDRALLDQLKNTRTELARLALGGPPPRTTPADHRARLKTLEEQREKLEDQISRRSAEFRAQAQPVTLEAVQAALPPGAALVEYAIFRPFNARFAKQSEAYDTPRYVAYVLSRQGPPQAVELGEKQAIDDAIEQWRKALRNRRAREVKKLARAVDRIVMQPLRPLLGRARHLLVAPEGSLNLIPFGALVDGRNEYLIKRYQFSYLTSGRDLLRLRIKQPSRQSALIIANPDFGESATQLAPAERILKIRPASTAEAANGSIISVAFFPALPGTAGEAAALKTILPEADLYSAQQASETQLKQAAGPAILHVATHGFFFEDPPAMSRLAAANLQLDNPLLRSGLALAGANLLKRGSADDGIFTALEAAGLDLWGTRLVVLSACDTGVGEVKNGEGVYGLRRALVLAGSETQVMSLWPVSDEVTRDLMIDYYRRLRKGAGRGAALHQVQLRLLERSERKPGVTGQKRRARDLSHPYYWASFIQSGEWASLEDPPTGAPR